MDKTSKELFDELHTLSRNMQLGLDEMLAFTNRLSHFDKRTLMLFITLTSDRMEFEKIIKLLEKLEGRLFKGTARYKIESSSRKRQS